MGLPNILTLYRIFARRVIFEYSAQISWEDIPSAVNPIRKRSVIGREAVKGLLVARTVDRSSAKVYVEILARPGKQWVAVPLSLPVLYVTGLLDGDFLCLLMRGWAHVWAIFALFIMIGLNPVSWALPSLLYCCTAPIWILRK